MINDPYVVATFLESKEHANWVADGTNPVVTISRQHGAGGDEIAMRTAQILTERSNGKHPWVVIDKEIAEKVINDHHLPKRIANFLSAEEATSIEGHIEGMLGISVPYKELLGKMADTMVRVAKLGHVVLVGRGAHVVTAHFPRAVHVRVIGSFDQRVERLMKEKNISRDHAAADITETDENRRHFVAKHFKSDLDDPTKYDMVFNTDRISTEEAARLIAHLVSSPDFRTDKAKHLVELRHQVLG